jgi:hypothetical protein
LFYTQDDLLVGDGGVILGSQYEIFESTLGGATRSLYQGETGGGFFSPPVQELKEAGGALYFYTDNGPSETGPTGTVYRLPLDGAEEPEVLVEGAANPVRDSGDRFAVSADGRLLAYYTRAVGGPYTIHVRDLSNGSGAAVAVGTASTPNLHHLPLVISADGSQLLHQLRTDQTMASFDEYSVLDLGTGTGQRIRLGGSEEGVSGERFYAEGNSFVAAYVAGFSDQNRLVVVVHRLPDGSPQASATFPDNSGGWTARLLLAVDAVPNRYAFWRREYENTADNQPCALHVLRLDGGDEQRVAGPVPPGSGAYCGGAPKLAPDGDRIAYLSPSSRELYVADVEP